LPPNFDKALRPEPCSTSLLAVQAKLEQESEDAILREMQMQSDALAHEQANPYTLHPEAMNPSDAVHRQTDAQAYEQADLYTLNPQPSTLNPQPSTLNPQPSNLNPQPSTLRP